MFQTKCIATNEMNIYIVHSFSNSAVSFLK